jgi:hypothetical protein
MNRRRAQAGIFSAERHYLAMQAKADEAEAEARAKAGPSGEGFTTIYQRALGPIDQETRAGMPAHTPDDHRAVINARLDADHERRLRRAMVEEVQAGRVQTRADLTGMQAALLAQLAREPERYEEIVAQGAAFTAGNILPDEETAVRVADWYAQAEKVLAAAKSERASVEEPSPLRNRRNTVEVVVDAPAVRAAWEASEKEATPENRRRISEALIEAQEDAGIPASDQTPLSPREEQDLARTVLEQEGEARIGAIRRLAADLQAHHGDAGDLALKGIARHWSDDERSLAFAGFLAGQMDNALIVDPERPPQSHFRWFGRPGPNTRIDRAFIDAEGHGQQKSPLPQALTAYADEAARRQRTSPAVRDEDGNFLRGEPLGEAIITSDGDVFYDRSGVSWLADGRDHLVLLDRTSGRWLVFNRMVEHDTYERGSILPWAKNRRTGTVELGLSDMANDTLEGAKLPGDVLSGRADPNSPEAIGRSADLAGSFSGGGLVTHARPGSVATSLRRPPKRGVGTKYDVVEIKTTPTRSSNAVRGTPEHEALNNPKPNTIYNLDNGETFRTNKFGILDEIEYRPSRDKRGRNSLQTKVGKLGLEDDVGGHIRGAGQGGSSDRYNLIPQNANFNNGAYKRWENEIFSRIENVEVIRIVFKRKKPSDPRPDSMRITYEIDGKNFTRDFGNNAGGKKR